MESASGKHQEHIERLIARAVEHAAREAKGRWLRPGQNPFARLADVPRDSLARSFRGSLDAALVRLANQPGRPSIRMTAPDTGGRSFHVGHVAVSRFTCCLAADEIVPSRRKAGPRKARDKRHTSRCSEYMQYMEREEATELTERDREASASSVIDAGRERSPRGLQAYLEDPAKEPERAVARDGLSPPLRSIFSLIGETLEERMAFWDHAEAHAKGEKSTIQHRFIIELPHEAAPEDRVAIVEELVKRYEKDKIPYAAVLHAPTDRNDPRNFHLHVALLAYPAWVEKWPAGGKDARHPERPLVDTWTFAATETRYNRKRRSFETVNPFKKATVIPEYYRRNFVRSERRRIADIVNARMAQVGNPVRYDHRKYKAMGLNVEPMRSISRVIADKSKAGKVALLDERRLKREIELELDRLAQARAPAFSKMKAVHAAARAGERSLRAVEKDASFVGGRAIRRRGASPDPEYVKGRAHDYVQARRRHLDHAIAADHELKTIERVIEATDPATTTRWRDELARRLWRARALRNPLALERLRNDRQLIPDRVFAQLLQNAAKEHLNERTAALDASAKRAIGRIGQALAAWRRAAAGERRDLNPGVPAHVPRLYGIPHQVKPISPRQNAPTPKAQLWLSTYDFLDSLYTKPLERFATDLFRRFSKFIVENADSSVPGRTPLDLVEKLVTAVKQGPMKVEQLIAGHRVGTPSPPGNRQPLKAGIAVLGHGMAPDPVHDSVRDTLPVSVADPTAQSGRTKGGADEILPVGAGAGRIDEVQGRGGETDCDGQLWQPADPAAGARPKLDAINQPAPETASAIRPAIETGGPDEDKAASAGTRKRRKKRPESSSLRRPDGWGR